MSLRQQPWQATANFSGVTFSQDEIPVDKIALNTTTSCYQEFQLPYNYERGVGVEAQRPDISGFQFLAEVTTGFANTASCGYTFDVQVGTNWVPLASGVAIGSAIDGNKVWFDVIFDQPVPVVTNFGFNSPWEDQIAPSLPWNPQQKYRFGVRGRAIVAPVQNFNTQWNAKNDLVFIFGEAFSIPTLIPFKPTEFFVEGEHGILFYDPDANTVTFSHQYGLNAIWYTTPNTLAYMQGQAFQGNTLVTNAAFTFRLLSESADEGTDFLGNSYRSVAKKSVPANVSTLNVVNQNDYWLSKPNPSKFAVECLYFDVTENSGPQVIDRILVDPLTVGPYFTVYYSSDGDPGSSEMEWENKLWSRVPTSFRMIKRESHTLPNPITAKYLCIEFSHLQAKLYAPGELAQPTIYKKFPQWVEDYYIQGQATELDNFISQDVQVTFDKFDLFYVPFTSDLDRNPTYPGDNLKPLPGPLVGVANSNSLVLVNKFVNPYAIPTASLGGNSLIGQFTSSTNPPLTAYPVENQTVDTFADTTFVSSVDRQAVLDEQLHPIMSFYLTSRHQYRVVQAAFEYDRGYFAGVRELAFNRDCYTATHDHLVYLESTGDNLNVLINDFEQVNAQNNYFWHEEHPILPPRPPSIDSIGGTNVIPV